MKKLIFLFAICCTASSINACSQTLKFDKSKLEAVHVSMSIETLSAREVVKVIKDSTIKAVDEPTFVKLKEVEFCNGTIEVSVLSKLLPHAPDFSRGFIGVAFRINDDNSKFECIYLRPANGRDNSQVRRNHSIQYFSFPGYKFDKLRKEATEQYESYSDMGLNEWIRLKIEVRDAQAKLFIGENKQPSLIVNDLKLGSNSSGAIGLWVDVGTEGYFSEVTLHHRK